MFFIKPPLLKYSPTSKLDVTVHPRTVKKPNSPPYYLVIHIPSTHWPSSHCFSSSLAHELPLPSLHPSLTSHTPPTPPPCQLTPEHGHIVPPFDPPPFPALSEHTGPETHGFSVSLSPGPVARVCDRWALASSSDPPCCGAHMDGVREHWLWCYLWQVVNQVWADGRQGKDKRDQGYGWGAITWFVLYRSWHLARLF